MCTIKEKTKAKVGRNLTAKPHRTLERCFDLVNKSSLWERRRKKKKKRREEVEERKKERKERKKKKKKN